MTVYRFRVVIAGISPLIWRRLEVAASTTVAGLHAIVQAVFGWSGEHLHRFVIGGAEYGIFCLGGPGFRDDARQVRLAGLRLREGERFIYEYNFSAAWRVDLRVEQIARAQPGGPTRGARAVGAPARLKTGMAFRAGHGPGKDRGGDVHQPGPGPGRHP
jgi:Plasmid pRiA4b ORF-3-like protein